MIYPGFSNLSKNDSEGSITVVADSSTTRASTVSGDERFLGNNPFKGRQPLYIH
jgi:hypothetical protein